MNQPFRSHKGIIALLDRSNVDTDQIIPKQFLKSIARTGFGGQLFYDWRYLPDGKPNPDFSLNQARFKDSSILVTRNNFGCGSSREHAVWAIMQAGFRVVVAPWKKNGNERISGFADIFRNNSFKNSLLTIELSEEEVNRIFQVVEAAQGLTATADVKEQHFTLHLPKEISFRFELNAAVKERLLRGLDDIGTSLKQENEISAYEKTHHAQMKWSAQSETPTDGKN